jgi:hypothetical protein
VGDLKAARSERAKAGNSDSQNVQERLANGAGMARLASALASALAPIALTGNALDASVPAHSLPRVRERERIRLYILDGSAGHARCCVARRCFRNSHHDQASTLAHVPVGRARNTALVRSCIQTGGGDYEH